MLLPFDQNKDILKVPFVFTPRDIEKYEETVLLDINGLHTMEVKIKGEGVPFKIDLDKQEDSLVDFGIAKVGQDLTKVVTLVNSSKKSVKIGFQVDNQLETLQETFI